MNKVIVVVTNPSGKSKWGHLSLWRACGEPDWRRGPAFGHLEKGRCQSRAAWGAAARQNWVDLRVWGQWSYHCAVDSCFSRASRWERWNVFKPLSHPAHPRTEMWLACEIRWPLAQLLQWQPAEFSRTRMRWSMVLNKNAVMCLMDDVRSFIWETEVDSYLPYL